MLICMTIVYAQYQYFMIDFCYFVNWICVVTTFAPGLWNGKLLLIAFVMGNGVSGDEEPSRRFE